MITALLYACDENVEHATICLRMLYMAEPQTDWMYLLEIEAMSWGPFISRGLSIQAWLDIVRAGIPKN